MSRTEIVAEPGVQEIVITRVFDAPRELLFRAHVEPELLERWVGPCNLTLTVDCLEARDGGRWHFTHRDSSGTAYGFHGVFHNTPSVDGIVRTFEFEGAPGHVCLETLTFEERGEKTLLRGVSVYQSVADRDAHFQAGMSHGVNESMDRLTDLLAHLVPAGSRS